MLLLDKLCEECINCKKTLNGGYFCSRSCKNAALLSGLINDDNIDYDISNLKIKDIRNLNKLVYENNKKYNLSDIIIMFSKRCLECKKTLNGGYFCSRSCKNCAIQSNLISDNDIDDNISNLKLKI